MDVVLLILVLTKKEPKKVAVVDPEETKTVKAPVVAVENSKEKQVKALLKEAFDLDPVHRAAELRVFYDRCGWAAESGFQESVLG